MDSAENEDEYGGTSRGTVRDLMSSRTNHSRGTPGRASLGGEEIVMDLGGSQPVMVDSQSSKHEVIECPTPQDETTETEVQEIGTSRSTARSFVTDRTSPVQNDTYRSILTTGRLSRRLKRIGCGLSIITWDEFLENPNSFNELFYLEGGNLINFDPDEVNVFFHDSSMMQPVLGSPSGQGNSWTVYIESINHLKQVRVWMLERISVISAIINNNKSQNKQACLVAINPGETSVKRRLEHVFEQTWESILARRKYCIEIDLASCIEEWCMAAFGMKCEATAVKVYITNGDEYEKPFIENKVWRFICFPCLALQKIIYNVQRRANYDDYFVSLKGEPLSICTGSKSLQIYTGAVGGNTSSRSPRLKKSVSIRVTTSTQTLNSTASQSPVECISEADYDNGAFDDRGEEEEAQVFSPTPRAETPPYDHSIPRPRSRMSGRFSLHSHISTSRSEKKAKLENLKENDISNNTTVLHPQRKEIFIKESVVPFNYIQSPLEINYVTSQSPIPAKTHQSTLTHRLGGSQQDVSRGNSGVCGLILPGKAETKVKSINESGKMNNEEPKLLFEQCVQSENRKSPKKSSKRIGSILKEIIGNTEIDRVNLEKSNHKTITPGSEPKSIAVGSEQEKSNEESRQSNDVILETVRDMFSKENTFSSGFDEAMSCASEVISSPRRDHITGGKLKPKPFLVEPQRKSAFINAKYKGRVRQAFSDVDQDDEEFTDYEPDSIMSDNIAVNSPRLVSVKRTSKTATNCVAVISDLDSDLEIFDIDNEEEKKEAKPSISSTPRQKMLNPALIRGPRGQRNSRRRYLALNSLRKKTRIVGIQPSSRR